MQWVDGKTFVTKLEEKSGSPLDVEGIDVGLTADEIVQFIREGREVCGNSTGNDCDCANNPCSYELREDYDLSI